MTNHEQVMRQALEALEMCRLNGSQYLYGSERDLVFSSITALRAALAEPQIDPVDEYRKGFIAGQIDMRDREQAEPAQEPAYWEVRCTAHPKWMRVDEQQFDEYVAHGWEGQKLYTAPPQRKPLTEEQKLDLVTNWFSEDWAIKNALGLLDDYDTVRAHGIGE